MDDYARITLTKHINTTNNLLKKTLHIFDSNANSEIIGTLELGYPNDVIRLAGGFAIGLMVKWEASIPFIPVDTTVNVCTTTICEIDHNLINDFNLHLIKNISEKISCSSFSFNFYRGNHFISLLKGENNDKYYIILHSDAYRKGYDSISPLKGNWYFDDIKVYEDNNRYLRYIIGKKAETYYKMTKIAELNNEQKHSFVLELLTKNKCNILNIKHFHHHFMPNEQTIIIGCYFVEQDETVPIMTFPGHPIYMFRVLSNENSMYKINNKILTPHGWGKGSVKRMNIAIDNKNNLLRIGEHILNIENNVTLNNINNISVRHYAQNKHVDSYLDQLNNEVKGINTELLLQLASYSKNGLIKWHA